MSYAPRYRHALPQLQGDLFLTDGGLETTLIFLEGQDLPHFAAFHLLGTQEGRSALRRYFSDYADLARRMGLGLILEAPTWRASRNWGARLGYSEASLADANRAAVALLEEIREVFDGPEIPVVVSGCIGPRGDAYVPDFTLSETEAEAYHQGQIDTLADSSADMVCALTLNRSQEAIGITRAARRAGMPVALSFTVETDGNLPTGQTLEAAIQEVDAATDGYPSYFMVNCAHPTHLEPAVSTSGVWRERIRGLRANASCMSHAQLDEATELDDGDPLALGMQVVQLRTHLGRLNVLGGCCGTDLRHIEQIATRCAPLVNGFHQPGRGGAG